MKGASAKVQLQVFDGFAKSLLKMFKENEENANDFLGGKLATILPALLVTVKGSIATDIDTEAIADALKLP